MRGDERGQGAMFFRNFSPELALILYTKDSRPDLPKMDHQQTKLSHETVPLKRNPEQHTCALDVEKNL
jgi:hypothetical protein